MITLSVPVSVTAPYSLACHAANMVYTQGAPAIDLLFFGDSLTTSWEIAGVGGYDTFRRRFTGWNAAAYGGPGDHTGHMLWRLRQGEVRSLRPKVVVLCAGANQLWPGLHTDEAILDGIIAVAIELYKELPGATILVHALMPQESRGGHSVRAIKALNMRLAHRVYALGDHFVFFDPTDIFFTFAGTLDPHLFTPDRLHLSRYGYEVWGARLYQRLASWFPQDIAPRRPRMRSTMIWLQHTIRQRISK